MLRVAHKGTLTLTKTLKNIAANVEWNPVYVGVPFLTKELS